MAFAPATGPGYANVLSEARLRDIPASSTVRRDLMLLIQYAAAKVECQTRAWTYGNGGPLVLGDMSARDGSSPPGHIGGPHVGGGDIDVAYYQVHTPDNQMRPICLHTRGGLDLDHCVAPPDALDAWRTALFIGALYESADVRTVGVDGMAAPAIIHAIDVLCSERWIDAQACTRIGIDYETSETGRGWYFCHHDHMHVSMRP